MTRPQIPTFRSLVGIEPGVTTLDDVQARFGSPESTSTTQPSEFAGGDAGGDLIWHYDTRGVLIYVDRDDVGMLNPLVDEVHLKAPFDQTLPCGLRIGLSLESARKIIADYFQITDEYEDAIYFIPDPGLGLLASVENMDTNEVLGIELMRYDNADAA